MAVQEINAKGGVLGRQLKLVIVDPASNWDLFAEKAKQLLVQEKVAVVFGCWTSVSRKSVLPVFEEHNGLLFYPVQYEGEECSKNVFTPGSGQPAGGAGGRIPDEQRRGATRSSISWEPTTSIPKRPTRSCAMLLAKKVPAANIMEEYTPFHHQDYQTIVGKIKSSPPAEAPALSARLTATATCRSIKSSPIRDCAPKMRRSWRLAWRKTSCAEWTRPRWSATCRLELLPERRHAAEQAVRRRFQGVLQKIISRTATNASPTIRLKRPIWVHVWKQAVERRARRK